MLAVAIVISVIIIFLLGLLVFGGGQVFIPFFTWFWNLLPNFGVEISQQDIRTIFIVGNSTPGVLSLKFTAATGLIISKFHWWGWLIAILFYLVFTLPAILLVVIWNKNKAKHQGKTNTFWMQLINLFRPAILGIIIALIVYLFINLIMVQHIFNTSHGYIAISKNVEKTSFFSGVRYWLLISFVPIWVCVSTILYLKKVNIFYILIGGLAAAMVIFAPWI